MLGPSEASAELFLQIHQNQNGMVKIDQIEAHDLVPVQRNQTQLPCCDSFPQLTSQPLRDMSWMAHTKKYFSI